MRKWFEKVKHFAMPLCLLFALLGGPGAAHAQDTTITGRVTNEKGEFMNGATVMEVGTTNAVVTDANGQYTLKLKNANAVEYSFPGFKPQEIRVGAQHVIDVVLVEDVSTLDELVVVGYGRQRKVSVVGAQSALRAEDIESFTVLKDASATAVYGVRGANGVIIIKTKPGKVGKPSIAFDYYESFTRMTNVPKMADAFTYMAVSNEAYANAHPNSAPLAFDAYNSRTLSYSRCDDMFYFAAPHLMPPFVLRCGPDRYEKICLLYPIVLILGHVGPNASPRGRNGGNV